MTTRAENTQPRKIQMATCLDRTCADPAQKYANASTASASASHGTTGQIAVKSNIIMPPLQGGAPPGVMSTALRGDAVQPCPRKAVGMAPERALACRPLGNQVLKTPAIVRSSALTAR